MTRMILAKCAGAALALTVMAGFAGQASAGLRQYCDSYARDVAHRKTNGGALIGGLIDRGEGAIVGGVAGTILGAGVSSDRYKRVYTNAFERCIDNYEGQGVPVQTDETKATEDKAAEIKVTETKATEKKVAVRKVAENEATEKAEASAASVTKACSRKYRSYDPRKGKYKSVSGKWRPCRL